MPKERPSVFSFKASGIHHHEITPGAVLQRIGDVEAASKLNNVNFKLYWMLN